MSAVRLLVVTSVVALLGGCGWLGREHDHRVVVVEGKPIDAIRCSKTLAPDALPYEQGSLILAGTEYPIEMRQVRSPGSVEFVLERQGEVLEVERYVGDDGSFRLVQGGGATYLPAIPLILYGRDLSEPQTWNGEVKETDVTNVAAAQIRATREPINIPGGRYDAYRIDVRLRIDSRPAVDRAMKFWFVPNRGIVKREFGSTSTRLPSGDGG